MSHITVTPEKVVFHVRSVPTNPTEIALPVQPLQEGAVEVTVTNRHSHDAIVYAVRTNVPFQFVVKNAEGLLQPKASTVVTVQLRRSARRTMPTLASRFLVQYAIYVPVPDSSNSSQSTGVLEAEERLRHAALRLGKEWRGRNIDLYDSGSVVVPCIVTPDLPPLSLEEGAGEALTAEGAAAVMERRKLEREIAVAEALYNALVTKQDALKTLVQQADSAIASAEEARKLEARTQPWWKMPGPIESVAVLLFVCTTVLLAFHL